MQYKYRTYGADWDQSDRKTLEELLRFKTMQRMLHQVELEIDGKFDQLGTINLTSDVTRAMQLQAEARGMLRVLDLFEELSIEGDDPVTEENT